MLARATRLIHLRFISTNAPRHRGRNLTERYQTLQNALTQKTPHQDSTSTRLQPLHKSAGMTIAGFLVPEEPVPPADDECCMSGCAVCVYDLYEESLAQYKASLERLRSSLKALSIPEHEWPAHIRATSTPMGTKQSNAVLSAFEEMEHALEEKRARRAAGEAEKRARGEMMEGEQMGIGDLVEGIRWMLFPRR